MVQLSIRKVKKSELGLDLKCLFRSNANLLIWCSLLRSRGSTFQILAPLNLKQPQYLLALASGRNCSKENNRKSSEIMEERTLLFCLLKQPRCKSEQTSLSQLQKWIIAVTIFSSFSVDCQCFLRGLSPVFRAMSPVASTHCKTSTLDIYQNLPL